MLLAIIYIYNQVGTTDYLILLHKCPLFDETVQKVLWIAFFCSFAVKVPMVPFHIWLPEAHVEAPTAGSVILAGILLKLGTYGLLRFSLPLFPLASIYFAPLVYAMSLIAIIYTSLTTLRQIDLKKIIAYSSIAHMGFVTIGLFSFNIHGVEGSIIVMLSHGFVSSALFLCIGVLYDRHHTRILTYYGGLVHTMPIFATIFFFFTLANISLPGTSSFVGEFLVLIGTYLNNRVVAILASSGIVLGAAYSLWLYNRVMFGPLNTTYISQFEDVSLKEFAMLAPFIFLVLLMGIYPTVFLEPLHQPVAQLIQHIAMFSEIA